MRDTTPAIEDEVHKDSKESIYESESDYIIAASSRSTRTWRGWNLVDSRYNDVIETVGRIWEASECPTGEKMRTAKYLQDHSAGSKVYTDSMHMEEYWQQCKIKTESQAELLDRVSRRSGLIFRGSLCTIKTCFNEVEALNTTDDAAASR